MLVLILDRTAAIERIVALATEPRVPDQFRLRAVVDAPDFAWPLAEPAAADVRERELDVAGAYHIVPAW